MKESRFIAVAGRERVPVSRAKAVAAAGASANTGYFMVERGRAAGFKSHAGADAVTGWGSPMGMDLLAASTRLP